MTQATFSEFEMTDDGVKLVFTVDGRAQLLHRRDGREFGIPSRTPASRLAGPRPGPVVAKLQRKVQATAVTAKLGPLLGQTVTF